MAKDKKVSPDDEGGKKSKKEKAKEKKLKAKEKALKKKAKAARKKALKAKKKAHKKALKAFQKTEKEKERLQRTALFVKSCELATTKMVAAAWLLGTILLWGESRRATSCYLGSMCSRITIRI